MLSLTFPILSGKSETLSAGFFVKVARNRSIVAERCGIIKKRCSKLSKVMGGCGNDVQR